MKLALIAFVAVAVPLAVALPASADEGEGERIGEVHVTLQNAAYVKVQINDEEYSATEFTKNGKRLIVKGLALADAPFKLTLTPFEDSLAEATIEVTEKQFRKKRSGRIYLLVASLKPVKFGKRADTPPPPEPPEVPAPPTPSDDKDDDEGDEL